MVTGEHVARDFPDGDVTPPPACVGARSAIVAVGISASL
jgi:hypothetical protein